MREYVYVHTCIECCISCYVLYRVSYVIVAIRYLSDNGYINFSM